MFATKQCLGSNPSHTKPSNYQSNVTIQINEILISLTFLAAEGDGRLWSGGAVQLCRRPRVVIGGSSRRPKQRRTRAHVRRVAWPRVL